MDFQQQLGLVATYNWARICLVMETVRKGVRTVCIHTFLWTANVKFTTVLVYHSSSSVYDIDIPNKLDLPFYYLVYYYLRYLSTLSCVCFYYYYYRFCLKGKIKLVNFPFLPVPISCLHLFCQTVSSIPFTQFFSCF